VQPAPARAASVGGVHKRGGAEKGGGVAPPEAEKPVFTNFIR